MYELNIFSADFLFSGELSYKGRGESKHQKFEIFCGEVWSAFWRADIHVGLPDAGKADQFAAVCRILPVGGV